MLVSPRDVGSLVDKAKGFGKHEIACLKGTLAKIQQNGNKTPEWTRQFGTKAQDSVAKAETV